MIITFRIEFSGLGGGGGEEWRLAYKASADLCDNVYVIEHYFRCEN